MIQIDRLLGACQEAYPPSDESCYLIITREDLNPPPASIILHPEKPVLSAAGTVRRLAGAEKMSGGAIHISGRTSRAAAITAAGPQIIQWQDGYRQVETWTPHPDSEETPLLSLAEEWSLHLRPLGKRLLARLDPTGLEKVVVIALPPVSADTPLPDWDSFLDSLAWPANTRVIFRDAGLCLVEDSLEKGVLAGNGVRHYVLFADSDLMVMAYDCYKLNGSYNINPRGGFALVSGKPPMKVVAIPEYLSSLSTHGTKILTKIFVPKKKSTWQQVRPRWPVPAKLEELLKDLSATFNSEFWSLQEPKKQVFKTAYARQAYKLLSAADACTTDDLVRGETGANNKPVSLADAVTMFHSVSQEAYFKRSLPVNHSAKPLGGIELPFTPTTRDLAQLPTSYIYRIWKPVRPSGYKGSYLKAGLFSLNRLLLIIAEHFDECTTLVMAEELMSFRGIKAEPSACFTASLFLYLETRGRDVRLV